MKIAVLKERAPSEYRVALTPDIVKQLCRENFQVYIEKDAGAKAGFNDQEYLTAGAKISNVPLEIVSDANIILKVQPTPIEEEINELNFAQEKAIILGFLNPYSNSRIINSYCKKNLTSFAMELVPRTTKAQGMDALSSQSNLAGMRAVFEAINLSDKVPPMLMTAAGTIQPAKALVLGVGVAGLQAIATLKRLGCVVSAYDIRVSAKEQAESLGAKFLELKTNSNFEDKTGYAKEANSEILKAQEELLSANLSKFDFIITTAQILGKKAPLLITKNMLNNVKQGCVIIDMAAGNGGNCEINKADEIIEYQGAKIYAPTNLATELAHDASKLYAKNIYNFIKYIKESLSQKNFESNDEIINSMLITHRGKIVNPKFRE